ncbi:MAG: hypothetical protein ACI9A7_001363 [Cyclobacteriaceae bacterium]|jgi:hypothetical protein
MVKFLQNFCFYGGLLVAVLGVIVILISNDSDGHDPVLLKQVMIFMIFVLGISIFTMLIIRSKAEE